MKKLSNRCFCLLTGVGIAALSSLPQQVMAASIYKTNNAAALNVASSWTNNAVPAGLDTAIWDANVSTAANCTNVLGANMTWGGLTIVNPAAPIQISADGNALTLTNLTMTSSTVSMTLNCGLIVGGNPTWQIGSSASTPNVLTIGSAMSGPGNIKQQYGKIKLAPAAGALPGTMAYSFSGAGTLDLGGNSQMLATVGMPWGATGTISNGTLTVSGSGINNPQNAGTSALDYSNLSGVSYTNQAQAFTIVSALASANGTVVVNLAKQGAGSNFINTASINVGSAAGFNGTGAISTLNLGPWNTFWTPSFNLSGFRMQTCTMQFQSGLSSSNLSLMGVSGANRVGTITIGNMNSGGSACTGTFDMGAGTLNCQATNLIIAEQNAATTLGATGTFNLGSPNGSLDVLSVTNARKTATTSASTSTGTINQNGSTAKIGALVMGDNYGTTAGVVIKSAYNLNGGTFSAQTILPGNDGAGTGGGSFRSINWTNGIIKNYDASTPLTILGGGNPQMTISAPGSGSRFFSVDANLTNSIQCVINQAASSAAAIVKNGAGGLDLLGTADNAYLGLNVSNGIVLLGKTSSASVHAIGNGLTLNGGSAMLSGSGGDQIVNGSLVTINSGGFELNGQNETIGGLAGAGGTISDAIGTSTLTVNVGGSTVVTNGSTITGGNLVFAGTGTQTFIGTDSRATQTTTVSSGTLQIGNGGASGNLAGAAVVVNSPGTLAFNHSGALNFGGAISGTGNVAQNGSGTLTLSGSDSHAGSTLVNSGTLAVASGASTIGGSIISVATNAIFDTTAGSSYYVAAGQLLNGSGSVVGDYILATGATNTGTLSVTGNVTLADGSHLNPGAAYTAGTMSVAGNVTFSGGTPDLVYVLSSSSTPGGGTNSLLTITGMLDLSALASGALNLQIHGTPASGTYVIATAGSISGSASAINVVGSTRYTYTPQIVGTELQLVITGNAGNLLWLGDGSGNVWDANNSGNLVWSNLTSLASDFFNTGDNALFDDSSANPTVNINATLLPASVTVNNASVNYTFANGGGSIDGPIALTKTNSGTLTIQNNNTFTGPVNVNGGTVSVPTVAVNGSAQPLGAGTALNLDGGTFKYTGPAVGASVFGRAINLGANGGTIEQDSSSGIYFFITNKIIGGGSLTKAGAQQLILGDVASNTGSNSYSGGTYVNNGFLQIRHASALGTNSVWINSGGSLTEDGGFAGRIMNDVYLQGGNLGGGPANYTFGGTIHLVTNSTIGFSFLTIAGQITGGGFLNILTGTNTLLNSANDYSGGTLISGGTLQLGTNGTSGWIAPLPSGSAITNNGTLTINRSDTNILACEIIGAGGVNQNGSGTTLLAASNSFTGAVRVNVGALRAITNCATGNGIIYLPGGGSSATLELAENSTIANPSIQLAMHNAHTRAHIRNVSGTNIVQSALDLAPGGTYWDIVSDGGYLILNGDIVLNALNDSTWRTLYLGGTAGGRVNGVYDQHLMAGGTRGNLEILSGIWTLGTNANFTGTTTVDAGATLLADNIDQTVPGSATGSGTVSVAGTIGGDGYIDGAVAINSGATLSAGLSSIGTLTLRSNLTLSGKVFIRTDKSLAQSNDMVSVAGILTNTASSTITVTNLGPALAAGDNFKLFNQPVLNGNILTIAGGGASVTWSNGLAVDGSITVLSVSGPVNTNAFLISLAINPTGALSPVFSSNNFGIYNATVPFNSTPTVTVINPTTGATNQLIYEGVTNTLVSGSPSFGLTLNANTAVTNFVKVKVTAPDGIHVNTYSVNLRQAPNTNSLPVLNTVFGNGSLHISWPTDSAGYRLQIQTNALDAGLGTNWHDWPYSSITNNADIPILPDNPCVFLRLIYP